LILTEAAEENGESNQGFHGEHGWEKSEELRADGARATPPANALLMHMAYSFVFFACFAGKNPALKTILTGGRRYGPQGEQKKV
jgi:hypothetical protein